MNELNNSDLEKISAGKPSFKPKLPQFPGKKKPGLGTNVDPNSVKKPTNVKPGQVALDLP